MYIERNTTAHARNNCYRGKAVSIIYFCVCARASGCVGVGTQAYVCFRACSLTCPARKAHAPTFSEASLATPHFSTLSQKMTRFSEKRY
jgi:hypothetical protein